MIIVIVIIVIIIVVRGLPLSKKLQLYYPCQQAIYLACVAR